MNPWDHIAHGRHPLAAAVALLIGTIVGVDIYSAAEKARWLYGVGVTGLSLQGDLQYHTQESRRAFIHALTTDDPNRQLPWVDRTREASSHVAGLIEQCLALDIEPEERQTLLKINELWGQYASLQDEMIARILVDEGDEALTLETTRGVPKFALVSSGIRQLKERMEAHAGHLTSDLHNTLVRSGVEFGAALVCVVVFIGALDKSNRLKSEALRETQVANRELASAQRDQSERNELLEMISRNEPLEAVLNHQAKTLQRWLHPGLVSFRLRREGILRLFAAPGFSSAIRAATERIALDSPTACPAVASREGKLVVQTNIEADWTLEPWREFQAIGGPRAWWAIPVASGGGEVLGTVDMFWPLPRHPSDDERNRLEHAARQAAVAIEHSRLYDQLAYQARHDALTELPNRLLCQDRLEHAIRVAARKGSRLAVIWIDLDRFKQVNDRLGHLAGDALLRQVAQRFCSQVRKSDTLARIGGDEFILVASDVEGPAAAVEVGRKLLRSLEQPVLVSDEELRVTASIGVSVYPIHGEDATTLARNADAAMYRSKRLGRNSVHLYAPEQSRASERRMKIDQHLPAALERGEFHLLFQPITDTEKRIVGVEALLRWYNQELGAVTPAEFIPAAEESGAIVPIGLWALEQACFQGAAWDQMGYPLRVSVNVSPVQFSRAEFPGQVTRALADAGLDARLLEIELTEMAVLQDLRESSMRMKILSEMGATITIDDFGVGYSSLNYLYQLPVDKIKIDRSFLSGLQASSPNNSIVEAIVTLAHGMNLDVVAEGIETEYQLAAVRRAGCDAVQGYLICEPLPVDEITEILTGGSRTGLSKLPEVVPAV